MEVLGHRPLMSGGEVAHTLIIRSRVGNKTNCTAVRQTLGAYKYGDMQEKLGPYRPAS